MKLSDRPEQFFVISPDQMDATTQLAQRIEKEISPNRREGDAQCGIKATSHSIALSAEQCADMDAILEILSRKIFDLAGLCRADKNRFAFLP
jgi:hypothetical protein